METSSKVTLYDMLAMVIPGFLLLMLPFAIFGELHTLCDNKSSNPWLILIIFIASYMLGLIYHRFSILAYIKQIIKKCNWKESFCKNFPRWIVLIIYFRNNQEQIQKIGEIVEKESGQDKKDKSEYSLPQYYKAYYFLMKNNMLNNIPILEVQVAFTKNIASIAFLYSILPLMSCTAIHIFVNNYHPALPYCIALTLLILTVALLWTMVKTQDKIYELVWEGDKYLRMINNEKNN